jgi:hypothetical protein
LTTTPGWASFVAMRWHVLLVAAVAMVLAAACETPSSRTCEPGGECRQGGVPGQCLQSPYSVDHFCAYPDTTCPSGNRWGVLAGDGLAQMCVAGGGGADAGTDAPVGGEDAAPPDAPTTPPVDNGQAADIVLGQPDFTTSGQNTGGLSASSISAPVDVAAAGGRLIIADQLNNRALIWTTPPTTNKEPADVVLGQTAFTLALEATTQSGMRGPVGAYTDGVRLFVADTSNNRVLIWFSVPAATAGAQADIVLGQSSFNTNTAAGGQNGLNGPTAVWGSSSMVVVADTGNNRVLIWKGLPLASGAYASVVVGQPDFDTTAEAGPTASSLKGPSGVVVADGRLFVADAANNRVLIWNAVPTSGQNGQPADVVVGQPHFTSGGVNAGAGDLPRGFKVPMGIAVARGSLFIADAYNNRVIVHTPAPTTNFELPDAVLGFGGFANDQAPASPLPNNLKYPYGVAVDGDRLYVTDTGFNRVLGFTLK